MTTLKELIKEQEFENKIMEEIEERYCMTYKERSDWKQLNFRKIIRKQVVEAVDKCKPYFKYPDWENSKDWQKLKKLVEVK